MLNYIIGRLARMIPQIFLVSILAFIITLLAGLYPAVLAARMEPVEALRAEK